jgi:hypothetical protein
MMPAVAEAGRSSIQRRALAAYSALASGEAEPVKPVIELLHDEVAWSERVHSRLVTRLQGSDAVAARLRRLVDGQGRLRLRGVEILPNALVFTYRRPWWDTRHRLSVLAASLSGAFTQTVVVDDAGIRQIYSTIDVFDRPLLPLELVTATEQHLERSG